MILTASARASDAPEATSDERLARTRVSIIAAFLGLRIWLNPSWAMVAIVPFIGPFPAFGQVDAWRLVCAVGLHVVNGAIALWFKRKYAHDPSSTQRWLKTLTLFQALVGLGWGAMVWLLWVPGNTLNHAIVVLPIVAVLWSYATARTTYWTLYLAGVLPIVGLTLARIGISQTDDVAGLGVLFTVAFGYTVLTAVNVKRESDRAIRTGLANQDLTSELRTARDDALRKRFEAEAANASKTTFLANMSHELRTPLNAILGFSEIIANESFGPVGVDRYRDYAHDINASGSHLLAIINDILDISKIESGKMAVDPEPLDPTEVIDTALRVVSARVSEKGQNLTIDVAPDAQEVFADARAFKQITLNLMTNAVKFTQMGGNITLRGRRASDGGFELIVEDNGPGIEAALLDKIFQPFNQVDNRYNRQEGGTGLGLSLVRGLAALHGGKVWIETDVGTGVCAHVEFPPDRRRKNGYSPVAARLTA
jgi:two-component system cell cycle sensor histidine kinase PleC